MIGEADQFGPCDQICCCHDDFQPCLVRVERVEREITQPGGLGLTDAVLHPGVLAVAQFQAGDLAGHHPVGGVGDEPGDPVPVGVGEPQLRTWMGAFLAQDQPGPFRPCRQVHQIGGFGDPRAVADPAVGVYGRIPHRSGGEHLGGVADAGVDRGTEGEPNTGFAAGSGEGVGGAGRVGDWRLTAWTWTKGTFAQGADAFGGD